MNVVTKNRIFLNVNFRCLESFFRLTTFKPKKVFIGGTVLTVSIRIVQGVTTFIFMSTMYAILFLVVLVGLSHWTNACDIKDRGVNDAAKKAILKKHNELRAKVANGKQPGLPTASNMLEMEWDDHLARKAQEWAEQCVFEHDDATDRNGEEAGQNIGWEGRSDNGADWEGIIQSWFDEVKIFKVSDIGKYPSDENEDEDETTGHFTQVVWAETNKVGCGYVRYREGGMNEFLYGCNYSPGGNVEGEPIYKVGKPCTGCGGCGSIAGLCKAR